jgi:hypothetical protein
MTKQEWAVEIRCALALMLIGAIVLITIHDLIIPATGR